VNSMVALAVILLAWVTVDFILKFVYKPEAVISGNARLGPWNAIWSAAEDSKCLVVREPQPITTGLVELVMGITPGSSSGGEVSAGSGALCADSNAFCSVRVLTAQGLTEPQARVMSCIAMTESRGNHAIGFAKCRVRGQLVTCSTRACGLFQHLTAGSNQIWNNPRYHRAPCSTNVNDCHNGQCNLQTTIILFQQRGYQPWTGRCADRGGCGDIPYGQPWNSGAVACANRYDPNGTTRR
jgi:hypothetical protein